VDYTNLIVVLKGYMMKLHHTVHRLFYNPSYWGNGLLSLNKAFPFNMTNLLPHLWCRFLTVSAIFSLPFSSSRKFCEENQINSRKHQNDVHLSTLFLCISFLMEEIVIVKWVNYKLNNYLDKFSISIWPVGRNFCRYIEVPYGYR